MTVQYTFMAMMKVLRNTRAVQPSLPFWPMITKVYDKIREIAKGSTSHRTKDPCQMMAGQSNHADVHMHDSAPHIVSVFPHQ
jgi:hypothetical protein